MKWLFGLAITSCFPHHVQWPASVTDAALPWVQGPVPPIASGNASVALWRSLWWVRIIPRAFWHVYTSTATGAHQRTCQSRVWAWDTYLQELCHSSRHEGSWLTGAGVLHEPARVWGAAPPRQLRLHSSALTYSFRQGSAAREKLHHCRRAAVVASDRQVVPTRAVVLPACWLTRRSAGFPMSSLPRGGCCALGAQRWANAAWPHFTYSLTNLLVNWCFSSRRVIMILSGVKLYP